MAEQPETAAVADAPVDVPQVTADTTEEKSEAVKEDKKEEAKDDTSAPKEAKSHDQRRSNFQASSSSVTLQTNMLRISHRHQNRLQRRPQKRSH
jgi:hypothetical protein